MTVPKHLRNQRILVTGASGFIGSALCHRLIAMNVQVHAASRTRPPVDTKELEWWRVDLADPAAAVDVVARVKPELIFHLAGHVWGSRELEMVQPTFQSNLAATVNLMVAAAQTGCGRFILAGSTEEPEPQDGVPVPSSPYAAAKWAASGYARMFSELYRLPVVILTISVVYGPGQRDTGKLLPYVISSLLGGKEPKLSSGLRKVDWIYVDDVVGALIAAAETPGVEGKTIDIGSGHLVTIRDVVAELVRITGTSVRPVFGALPDRPMERERVTDVEGAFVQLGWCPRTSLERGLRVTVDWFARELDPAPVKNQ